MSRTTIAAIAFTVGLTAGVFLALRLKPRDADETTSLDLRLHNNETIRVRNVIDGDTVVLENGIHLRYLGINAPESGRFVKDPAPLSSEATARNRELVEGKEIRIELGREPLDVHGRALGRIMVRLPGGTDEVDAGEILVREGLARAMDLGIDAGTRERMNAAQTAAKQAGAGLWNLAATPVTGDFVSSTGGKVYHSNACAQVQRIKPENRRYFATAAEAAAIGLRPCEVCQKNQ